MPEEFKAHIKTAADINKVAIAMQAALILEIMPHEADQGRKDTLTLDWIRHNADIFREVFDSLVTKEMDFIEAWNVQPKETLEVIKTEMDALKRRKMRAS